MFYCIGSMFFVRQISFICVFKFCHERIRGGEKITVDSMFLVVRQKTWENNSCH